MIKSKLRPVSVDEIEVEFALKFPPDGSLDLLGDVWRDVLLTFGKANRCIQQAQINSNRQTDIISTDPAIKNLFSRIGVPPTSHSSPRITTPTTTDATTTNNSSTINALDLADFTARYTSLGGEYSQAMRLPWCGVLSVLTNLVRLESTFLEEDDEVEEENGEIDEVVVEGGSGVEEVVKMPALLPFEATSRLRTFFAKISEITANCCSNASETRSDWALFPVRNVHPAAKTIDATTNDDSNSSVVVAKVQVGFPPFALAETAARVWGGSVMVSCLWYDLLTTTTPPPQSSPLPVTNNSKNSNGQQQQQLRTLQFLEIGCGCAMPSCALTSILADILSNNGTSETTVSSSSSSPSSSFPLVTPSSCIQQLVESNATINLTVSDWQQVIVTQAIQNISKNRQVPPPPSSAISGIDVASNASPPLLPRLTVEGQVIDFFDVTSETGPYAGLAATTATLTSSSSSLPALPTTPRVYDLIFGSDIVYDFKIGAQVATALQRLLRRPLLMSPTATTCATSGGSSGTSGGRKRDTLVTILERVFTSTMLREKGGESIREGEVDLGGVALVCCERHRDGMLLFQDQLSKAGMEVLLHVEKAELELLEQFALPTNTTETSCTVFLISHGTPSGTATSSSH